MAFLSSLITNLWMATNTKKDSKKSEILDFMPNWDYTAPKEVKVQTMEEMAKVFQEIAKAHKLKVGIQPKPPRKRK